MPKNLIDILVSELENDSEIKQLLEELSFQADYNSLQEFLDQNEELENASVFDVLTAIVDEIPEENEQDETESESEG